MATKLILDFEKPVIELQQKIEEMRQLKDVDIKEEIKYLEEKVQDLKLDIYRNLTRWQRVQIARHPDRPQTKDYINEIFTDFLELHGDRSYRDDPSIIGGMAKLEDIPVMIVGHQKGRNTKTNIYRNFGMPHPEGYRKAARLFKLAEKYEKPVITFLDTPGAYPGIEAEERGQAEAIAANLLLMSKLTVPILVVIIGEGASGGAIGLGIGDHVFMLENSWYSVISPESCSSILWRSWDYKEQAAEALKLTAEDLKEQSIIDEIVPEPVGGAHQDRKQMFVNMKEALFPVLKKLHKTSGDKLVRKRREKFYNMGVYNEL